MKNIFQRSWIFLNVKKVKVNWGLFEIKPICVISIGSSCTIGYVMNINGTCTGQKAFFIYVHWTQT